MKRVFRCAAFVLVMLCLYYLVTETLLVKRGDGITPMKAWYDQPAGTVDVLVLGSSHSAMSLSTQTMWDECGLSTYLLWGSVQPYWNTYHYLVEALKTQTPKVVALETFASLFDGYSGEASAVANLEGMHNSLNKLQAIMVSVPPENWMDLITVLPEVHSRYAELTQEDFQYYRWNDLQNFKGDAPSRVENWKHGKTSTSAEVAGITETTALNEKTEQYLRRILELCQSKGIPVLLFNAPTAARESEQLYYNTAEQIGAEYGCSYVNFNELDAQTGLRADLDYYVDTSHMNTRGERKVSRYFAHYLQENYDLPDHRGDPAYESWEVSSRAYQNEYLPKITDRRSYFEELAHSRYMYYLVKGYGIYPITEAYEDFAADVSLLGDAEGNLGRALKDEWGFDLFLQGTNSAGGESRFVSEEEKAEIGLSMSPDRSNVLFEEEPLCSVDNTSLQLAVFDPYTKTCVDVVRFAEDEDYALQRDA